MKKSLIFSAFAASLLLASCAKAPLSVFKYEQPQQTVPSKVTLKNESQHAKTYLWDFGDKQTSTAQNPPAHEYTEPGTYTITLTTMSGKKKHQTTQTIPIPIPVIQHYQKPCLN